MTDHQNSSAGSDRALLATLVHDAMRFALWAAGEGISPVDGQPARAPEDFLYEYSCAADIEDWDGLAEVARDAVIPTDAQSAQVPKAWFCFVPSPPGEEEPLRIRAWTTDAERAKRIGEVIGREFEPLYASQPSPAATVEAKPFSAKENLREVVAQVQADIEAAQLRSSAATEDEPRIPLADHDAIGRAVLSQPWDVQKAIVTIAAHCTCIMDEEPSAKVADLVGCISQTCKELADALTLTEPQGAREPLNEDPSGQRREPMSPHPLDDEPPFEVKGEA